MIATAHDLISLTKPRVTALVVLTALGGLVLAPSGLPVLAALPFLLATAAVVGSANALNCWMERDSDRLMSRTRNRPLPAGRLSPALALWFGLGLGLLSVPVLALVTNPLTACLAAVALVSYVWLYTPMKRSSPAALYVGAIPGAMPPLMGWTAATGRIDAAGLSLFAILFLWQIPHFIAIATYRERDYARAGLMALPVVVGPRAAARKALLFTALLVLATLTPSLLGVAGPLYGVSAALLGVFMLAAAAQNLRSGGSARQARKLFVASLVHLTLLVGALAADVVG